MIPQKIKDLISELPANQRATLCLFLQYATISRSSLQDLLGINNRSTKWRILNQLKLRNLIQPTGQGKATLYKLTDYGEQVLARLFQIKQDGKM